MKLHQHLRERTSSVIFIALGDLPFCLKIHRAFRLKTALSQTGAGCRLGGSFHCLVNSFIMPDSPISYRRCHFPGAVIAHAVWLYLRFPLSFRDVEEMLAERGIQVSYETVRRWVAKFGDQYAQQLRRGEARPGRTWHLDEMAVRIAGKQHWLWRAVDENGATLEVLLQEQRDTDAAERFFRRLLGHAGGAPERITTDKLGSYAAQFAVCRS